MNHVHIPDLPWEEIHSPTRKFHSFFQNISFALGGIRNVGTAGGGHPFDLQIRRIPPGAAICPYHSHTTQWEMFMLVAGEGTARVNGQRYPVRQGEVFIHAPGTAHQLINTSGEDLVVYIIADNPDADIWFYPDSNKWGINPQRKFFLNAEVNYFEGEDVLPIIPPAAAAPTTAVNVGGAFKVIRPDELPWQVWDSPKKKFRSSSKELSIALGAKHNTPARLGGHPFDVEFNRVAPKSSNCPFHWHAAQWEMFVILSGTATVRAGDTSHTMRAGDAFIHPPFEPHQITNASATDDLTYYLIADNPPADYWHYPDSNKWGCRSPRKLFRMIEVDYWDGEE
jgi:uncharacterized cupin superfamily protein